MNESELVFTELLNCSRPELYQNRKHILDKNEAMQIASILKRRFKGEPLQYILGKTEFMELEFKVSPNVLIPRQETEVLVETVVKYATVQSSKKLQCHCEAQSAEAISLDCFVAGAPRNDTLHLLDLGTGSGCIAVSLAKLIRDCYITALDISPEGIAVARNNAFSHGVTNKINFMLQDILSLFSAPSPYDFIVSNPPYIRSADIECLQPELLYEPRIALDGGPDGLDFYRKIIDLCPAYLKKDGLLIIEIGFDQYAQIEEIFAKSEKFEIIECVKDYSGINRVIVSKKNYG